MRAPRADPTFVDGVWIGPTKLTDLQRILLRDQIEHHKQRITLSFLSKFEDLSIFERSGTVYILPSYDYKGKYD